jgi:predicted permease
MITKLALRVETAVPACILSSIANKIKLKKKTCFLIIVFYPYTYLLKLFISYIKP